MKIEQTLEELIKVCKIHETRMIYALDYIKKFLPMTPENLTKMDNHDAALLDSAITRFMQLQDTLGKKIFPRILKLVREFESEESFLDRLGRLERLHVIGSAETWEDLRDLRNELTHEYSILDSEETSKNINQFVAASLQLREAWASVEAFLAELL